MKQDGTKDNKVDIKKWRPKPAGYQFKFDFSDTDVRDEDNQMMGYIKATIHGTVSEATEKAYLGDFQYFNTWCRERGYSFIHADVATLLAYIKWMATRYENATIQRRLDSLSSIFACLKLPNTTKAPEVKLARERIGQALGSSERPLFPMTRIMLESMLKGCWKGKVGLRNKVLILLCYETMCKSSDLCRLRFEELDRFPDGAAHILLWFSEADSSCIKRKIPISMELFELVERWRLEINALDGFILRSIAADGQTRENLSPPSVNNILKGLQLKSFGPLCKDSLNCDSIRLGRAIDLLEQSETIDKIMERAGWSSKSKFVRYLRNYVAQTGR